MVCSLTVVHILYINFGYHYLHIHTLFTYDHVAKYNMHRYFSIYICVVFLYTILYSREGGGQLGQVPQGGKNANPSPFLLYMIKGAKYNCPIGHH
jgi:hypothetical protein